MLISPIVPLPADHLNQLEDLLSSNGLPADDCAAQADIFFGIFDGDDLIAAAGLEAAGDYSLLRSIVVNPAYRGQGLARRLTEFLLEQAQARQSEAVYLLTETATEYFENLGFSRVSRDRVPEPITKTLQFSSLCPDSANCLMTDLPRN